MSCCHLLGHAAGHSNCCCMQVTQADRILKLGSVMDKKDDQHGSVSLRVAQKAVNTNGGVGITGDTFCYGLTIGDADSSADSLEDKYSDWGGNPQIVWDSTVDWTHQVPSEENSYVEPDQVFPCEPIGQLRRKEYMRRPFSVRSRQCRANRQADNRIKQPRTRLDKHSGKHKRVGLVQWEVMLDHYVFV